VVEFLGVLSLLFVFEFITLVTHPFLEKWTNDTPVLMLLILVGLAMFLVPMHHRIEHWMKGKLVNHKQAQHAVQPVQTELAQQATDVGDDFVIENNELEGDVV
jgi:predicted ferric reductase